MFKITFSTLCLSLAILITGTSPGLAEPPKAELGEKGKNQAAVAQGDFKAILFYKTGKEHGTAVKIPHMYVMHGGKAVITLKGVSSGFDWPQAEAYIAEMDPSNPYPEVVFSTFSGGAHCCFNVLVATSTPDGKSWKAMNVGDYDGGFNLKDLDGDSRIEFQVNDQRFNYAFASYAGSVSPPLIYHVQGLKLVNMTREAPFRPYLMKEVADLDSRIVKISNEHERNGILAGYVALKGLVGQGSDAWNVMVNSYDRDATEGLTGCQAGYDKSGKCKAPEARYPNFPKALEAFLRQTGYL